MEVEASDTHPGNVQDFPQKSGHKFCSYIPGNWEEGSYVCPLATGW